MRGVRSGFVAIIGRPNVGKSTLLNKLLGRKVAIMSDKPQTTRSVVRGVLDRPEGQAVLLDTPGLHKPQTLLGERLNDLVRGTLASADVICFMVDAAAGVGKGDRFLAGELGRIPRPVVCAVNKMDAVPRKQLLPALDAAGKLADWARQQADRDPPPPPWEIVPVSARTGEQLNVLVDLIFERLPEGEPLYPAGTVTDEPEPRLVAEVIREKALGLVREELPHSIAVVVEEMEPAPGRDDLLVIRATLYVERPSQKPIVLGRQGSLIREVGKRARAELEPLLGTHIYLDLHVKVLKDWQRDPKQLQKLGFQ